MLPAKTFWMVWSPQGDKPPRVRYPNRRRAQKAAISMAKAHPTQKFYVVTSDCRFRMDGEKVVEEKWGGPGPWRDEQEKALIGVALMHLSQSPNLPDEVKPALKNALAKFAKPAVSA